MDLRNFNKHLFERYKNIENISQLSSPLIVSTNDKYVNDIKKSNNKILYIGQETNGWVNDMNNDDDITLEKIEDAYLTVLKRKNSNEFFKFVNNIIPNQTKNVIWSNTLICGKKNGVGHPIITNELKNLSLENLLFLYKYFKPNLTLFVSGPNNPYYEIVKDFLNIINSKIEDYPTINNPIIKDSENDIFWTYHPNYLNRAHLKEKVLNIIKKQ